MKRYFSQKEEKAVDEFKKELFQKFGEEILELKLFGSKARGDFEKYSDIDVLITLKKTSKKKESFILDSAVKILLEYGVNISPHIYSQRKVLDFLKVPSIFFQIIKREAVAL